MRRHHELHQTLSHIAMLAACCLAAALAGCGGEPTGMAAADAAVPPPAAATATATATAAPPAATAAPDTDLPANDPEATPADPAARTRRGLYLRQAFAETAELRLGGDVVWAPVECCTADKAELAMLTAYGMQAARNLGSEVPFFVSGPDLRVAAAVADRLELHGFKNVYLVTP